MIGLQLRSPLGFSHPVSALLFVLLSTSATSVAAADPAIRVELNATDSVQQNHCRLSFVVENGAESAIDTLKIDLALFGREGAVQRRMIVEMGPVRATKTVVRSFNVEAACDQIGAILLNDVTACAPGEPGACLDRLTLSSRSSSIRFYK